jgi:ATP-dependent DNA helicase UvrD/PcrA
MNPILDGLNEEQKCAVTSKSPVLQVLAPPGSGKTKTLTTRVAYLIEAGLRPWNIIVCTFTIKAAREMKERIKNFVGEKLESKLILGTFHSVARRYLTVYGHHVGIPKHFGIADSNDTLNILKRLIKKHSFGLEAGKARSRISKRKSTLEETILKNQYKTSGPGSASALYRERLQVEQQEFEELFAKYEEQLRISNLLDYDDLLGKCVELLKAHPECVANIEAVLIDEFQDTNNVQYELMSLFAQSRSTQAMNIPPSLTIVGDPDQSIYSFRNAEIKNLRRMREQYPDHLVVNLKENYRSSAAILMSAMGVIEQDKSRHAKSITATHLFGYMPVLKTLSTAATEASWLIGEIKRLVTFTGGILNFSDFVILVRSAHLSQKIESQLGQEGIPYRMVGGSKFFDRIEVRVLVDYLRVIVDPHTEAISRIINIPSRSIGEKTERRLLDEAADRGISLWTLLERVAKGASGTSSLELTRPARQGIDRFVNVILESKKKLAAVSPGDCLSILIIYLMQKISFHDWLKKKCEQDSSDLESRMDNIEELIRLSSAIPLDGSNLDEALPEVDGIDQEVLSGPSTALSEFLANVALATEKDGEDAGTNKVTISTIHAAKGLEWPVVFIPAAYEGSIPHSRAEDTDEERRLLFVGMTRAQGLLYISRPKQLGFGDDTTSPSLSSFLSDASMKKFFALQGPSMCVPFVQEVATILRRECPSGEVLTELFESLNYQEDPIAEDDLTSEDKVDLDDFRQYNANFRDSKRQKINGNGLSNTYQYEGTRRARADDIPPRKMPTQGGFVKASGLRRDEREMFRSLKSTEKVAQKPPIKAKAQKKPKPGQGTLAGFGFGKRQSGQSIEENDPDGSNTTKPLCNITNMSHITQSSNFQISTTMINRQVRGGPLFNRWQPEARTEIESSKHFLLLSSSPTKPGEEQERQDHSFNHSAGLSRNAVETKPSSGVTSFHTTTMDLLSSRSQPAVKKVYRLGTTRRANGH